MNQVCRVFLSRCRFIHEAKSRPFPSLSSTLFSDTLTWRRKVSCPIFRPFVRYLTYAEIASYGAVSYILSDNSSTIDRSDKDGSDWALACFVYRGSELNASTPAERRQRRTPNESPIKPSHILLTITWHIQQSGFILGWGPDDLTLCCNLGLIMQVV